jgi:signal peptidase I
LNKTITTFTLEQSPSTKQPPTSANSILTEQQLNKKRKATKPPLNTPKPQFLTFEETSSKPSKKQKNQQSNPTHPISKSQ